MTYSRLRQAFAIVLSAVLTFSLMTACSFGNSGETGTSEQPGSSTPAASSGDETTASEDEPTEPSDSVGESEESTTTTMPGEPGESEEPGDYLRAEDLNLADYTDYSSEALNWWYRRPTDLGTGFRDTVDIGIKKMIDPFRAIYQDPAEEKNLYLTFDAGYEHKANTAAILDVLLEHNVKAAFFVTGAYMDTSPDVVKRMINEGHIVANHTLDHKNPVETLEKEGILAMAMDIQANADKFEQLTSVEMPRLIRPGQGVYSEQVLAIYADMGYRTVFWDFAYRDWLVDDQPDPAASLAQLKGELHPGSVILLHAVSDTNVAILGDFLAFAKDEGYNFRSLAQYP